MLKRPLILSDFGQFSVHRFEKSNFLAWTWMKYFHMGIFVILRVCLIKKYGYQTQAFSSVYQCFLDHRVFRALVSAYAGKNIQDTKGIQIASNQTSKVILEISSCNLEIFELQKNWWRKTILKLSKYLRKILHYLDYSASLL